jgi:molybdopterin-guanine dinucleotide biosynthesis protein A
MDVLITAGGVPQPDELLYPYTRGGHKVMLDVAGKPIIQWVVDALNSISKISTIFIVGLPRTTPISSRKKIVYLESHGDLLSNIQYGAEEMIRSEPQVKIALLVSGDIPGLTREMVEWMLDIVEKDPRDIYYNVVDRTEMEKVFPGSRRTFTRLKDIEISGGDLSAFNPRVALDPHAEWRKLIAYRKNPIKQAAVIGLGTLFLLFTRQLTLSQLERRVCKKLKINGRVLISPFAEIGMDVDKPNQLEIMREFLTRRSSAA